MKKAAKFFSSIAAFSLSLLTSSALAAPYVSIPDQRVHPFPPYLLALTSMVITVTSSSNAELGDQISGIANGVDQGDHGDCWFESAVGAVSRTPRGQELISRMITRLSPNTYEVRFPDDETRAFKVSVAKMHQDNLRDSALWADVLEGAIMNRYPEMQHVNGVNNLEVKYGFNNTTEVGLRIMTGGQPSAIRPSDTSDAQLAGIMNDNMRMQIPMVAASKSPQDMPNPRRLVVIPNHCYAVLHFNSQTGQVTLRNPWGHNSEAKYPFVPSVGQTIDQIHDVGGGVITMPISVFKKHYRYLGWSQIANHRI